jgi:hypothetical protein
LAIGFTINGEEYYGKKIGKKSVVGFYNIWAKTESQFIYRSVETIEGFSLNK